MYGRRSTDVPLPPDLAPGAMPPASGPSTAAIPALRAPRRSGAPDPDDGGSGGRPGAPAGPEGALAWARFAGEMVLAVAAGVGVYLAFTVLWELLPYVALVAAPLIVTGLVAGASAWRERRGQGPVGVRLLAVLLFAGAVLVVAPAAQVLAAG
jgi:hypothetical protein